jgi:transmembrane sensor
MTGPSTTPPDWEQLGRYLAGESSPEEQAMVGRWIEEHPEDATLLRALDAAATQSAAAAAQKLDVEAALLQVKTRVRAQSRTILRRFAGFAAAAAVLLVAGLVLTRRTPTETPVEVSRSFATGVGQRDSVVLDDGSRIVIGPASRVEVRGRNVALQGEAYFKVSHDAARPFTVRAGDVTIRDLGTEFTVHHDPAQIVRIVVQEGAVEVTGVGASTATLHPGDVGIVTRTGVVQAERGAATEDDLAWTRGRLVFRNAEVGELAADLRRWYGVELRVTDSALAGRHFTGPFLEGEPRTAVVEAIAIAFGARVEWRGDTAVFRPATR